MVYMSIVLNLAQTHGNSLYVETVKYRNQPNKQNQQCQETDQERRINKKK